jgi:PAS domain S-box-containing protein
VAVDVPDGRTTPVVRFTVLLLAVAVGLWLTGIQNFLVFHATAELLGIGVAGAMFAVAWNTRHFSRNDYLTFVGIAYLFVAVLSALHTLAYRGMGVFPHTGANLATQLWIAKRGLEALSLLVAPFFLSRHVRPWTTLVGYAGVTAALLVLIFPLDAFPVCYRDGGPDEGLTPFKIWAEYAIVLMLLASVVALWLRRGRMSRTMLSWLTAAVCVNVVAEIAFTRYIGVYTDINKLGHILNVVAVLLLYRAIVHETLTHPYDILFRDLSQREEALRQSEGLIRAVTDGSPDPVFVKDGEGRIIFANPALLRVYGKADAEVLGRREADLFDPSAMADPIAAHDREVMRQGRTQTVEETFPTASGHRVFLTTKAPYRNGHGEVVGVLGIARDITRRKQLEQELREQAGQLAAANRSKEEFLATLSHELRTPLNAIVGWTEMLIQGRLDEAASQRALDVIKRNARVQVSLINDVLDIARVASGRLRLDLREANLFESLEAAVDAIRPSAAAKRIDISMPTRVEVPVLADVGRLQQVFTNLLSNAVKFSPTGSLIQVSIVLNSDTVDVAVRDAGIGLTAEEAGRVFERFWQADRSTAQQHGGLGLGLSLVRHLVELHGGEVRVDSPGPGQGATFTVTLPFSDTMTALEPSRASHEGEPTSAASALPDSLSGVKVLVVDDDPEAREVLLRALSGLGAQVCTAESAHEALRQLQQDEPDVIVSDIAMPSEDGYSLMRRIRALPGSVASTPAVALTAYGAVEDRARAIAAGFDRHVTKPVEPDKLGRILSSLIRVK